MKTLMRTIAIAAFGLFASTAAKAEASSPSVFDDAKAWWKFDQGGADGTVATTSEIHDARDPSRNKPTALYGSQGGPLWSVMDVRLPYQRRTVRSTALHFPCAKQKTTTDQCWYTSLAFSGLQYHGNGLTVVARVRLEGNGIVESDTILWNNAFYWNNNYGSAVGFRKINSGAANPNLTYSPYAFVAQNTCGNDKADRTIQMKVGEWYDVAYLLSEETVGGTRYDVVTFVVADVGGLKTHTIRKVSKRVASADTYFTRMAAMNQNEGWRDYNATDMTKNTSDNFKNFDGWIHQMAVWHRKLSLDEVKEAFGLPAEHPEQDVYAEANNWIRFDKHITGDGKLQSDEIRDVRSWNGQQDGTPPVVSQNGPQGGPVWTNVTVDLPGRGVSISSPCLYFPVATSTRKNESGETIHSAWITGVDIGNITRAGSYTVMARIYPMKQIECPSGLRTFFFNNGLEWNSESGSEFGFKNLVDTTGNTFYPVVTLRHSTWNADSLMMSAGNWYDIAFSITDNGFDETGKALKDSVLVAVQDVQHGFRSQTITVDALTTYDAWWGKCVLGAESTFDKLTDFYNATTKKEINSANSRKGFHGFIHAFAIWNRALTKEEIASAFSHPNNMVMGVGTANGSGNEFAGTGGSYDCTVDATGRIWRDMAGTLDGEHPELTLRFTPAADQKLMAQYLHVKSAAVGAADGETAQLTFRLNGRRIASTAEVGAYDDLWCLLPMRSIRDGENVLQIAYAGGTAASFALDSAEIVGAWQLGENDGSDSELAPEDSSQAAPDFMIGNRRLKHVVRGVNANWRDNYLHFYVPAEIAAKHAHAFKLAVASKSEQSGSQLSFAVSLNGVEKLVAPTGRPIMAGDTFTVQIEPGELKPGWNTINTQYRGTSGGVTFDYYKFAISDCKIGLSIYVR